MSDLTGFLLARIAEDEQVVPTPDLERKSTSRAWYSTDFDVVFVEQDRWLAECQAKRRLIDWAFANAEQIDSQWGDSCLDDDLRAGRCDDYGARAVEELLSKLALPYADHPDYPEEWRL